MKYPSLQIDFRSFVSPSCEIICADGATCEIVRTHLARGVYIKVEPGASLRITDTYIGAYSLIIAHHDIKIHSHCSIGEMVVIRDQDHRYDGQTLVKDSGYEVAPVIIGENCWLGAKSTILKGVSLGKNSVVGAHSLVNDNFPERSVVVGSPARKIR